MSTSSATFRKWHAASLASKERISLHPIFSNPCLFSHVILVFSLLPLFLTTTSVLIPSTQYTSLSSYKKKLLNPLPTSTSVSSAFVLLSFTAELLERFICIYSLQCHLLLPFQFTKIRNPLYHSCINLPAKVTSQCKCASIVQTPSPPQLQTCIASVPVGILSHRNHKLMCPLDSPGDTLGFPISTGTTITQLFSPHVLHDSSPSLSLQLNLLEQQVLMCLPPKIFQNHLLISISTEAPEVQVPAPHIWTTCKSQQTYVSPNHDFLLMTYFYPILKTH